MAWWHQLDERGLREEGALWKVLREGSSGGSPLLPSALLLERVSS